MHACTVTTSTAKADLNVWIVDEVPPKASPLVTAEAERLRKEQISGPQVIHEATGWTLLLKAEHDAHLIGGEDRRLLGKQIADCLRHHNLRSALVREPGDRARAQALVEGFVLGDYQYTDCRSGPAAQRTTISLRLPGHKQAVAAGLITAESQNQVRRLADGPGNIVDPASFVTSARRLLRGSGIRITVTKGLRDLERAGFPGLVQVGGAGNTPPALLEMHYQPARKPQSARKLALVGKGITFDSGGISLKPGAGMWMMKGDMGGAAAVLGAMLMVAARQPAHPVSAYCALAENLPGTSAQRPGDIYRARNGTWIHVDNTDAEGRLVLADVLTYACEQGASHIVDAATLTGACVIGLGQSIAAVMSPDADWAQTVRAAGQRVGEEFWPLPLYPEYQKQLEHPHADLNNIGGRPAGTITAGLFLQQFLTEGVIWAHCDIAGPAMHDKDWRYYRPGMTAFGARSLGALAVDFA